MIKTFIKFIFIFYFSIKIYRKSNYTTTRSTIYNLTHSIMLSFIATFIDNSSDILSYVIPLLLLWIITSIQSFQPQISFVSVISSFTISFCSYALISFTLIANFPFFRDSESYLLLAIITGILQYILIKQFLSIKRFQKGIPFYITSGNIHVITIICLLLVSLIIYISLDYTIRHLQILTLVCCFLTLAFLIYWWQAQITKSYRRSLEKRELESLRIEGMEKDALIKKLMEDNEKLATITHRDNTLISTLKNSTVNYLMTDFENKEEAIEARDKLIANIERLSEGRGSLLPRSDSKTSKTFDTGISLLDELLQYMDEDAVQNNIIFSVHIGTELKDFVPKDISESELVHVIDDLLKNAFKATRNNERRMVQLQFYKLGKHFVVEVADNGVPFEILSLTNMGIEKMTTYEDGSGIGLMDIWNTKESRRATYHLEEYASPSPFTKKISLTFDKKNRYSIRTWRKDEIQKNLKRIDLQVYTYTE